MSSSQPRSSISPNKSKRRNQEEEMEGGRQRSSGGTPSSTHKRRMDVASTPVVNRNERSLSQPPPTSIIRKQLRNIGVDLDSQPTSSTPAPSRSRNNDASASANTTTNNRNIRKNPIASAPGITPRRVQPTPGEKSHLLTSEKKRRSQEESILWTERKRRRSRFGAGGLTPKGNASGLGGWAGGRDESPLELLRRLARAPGFQLPPTPAGPTSPGLASVRQQSIPIINRDSIASRLSGASSIGGSKSGGVSSRSSLRPGVSVPGDLTRDEDGDVSSSTRANDSQLNDSNSRNEVSSSSKEMEILGRKAPKATLEGAGIFAHLLAKNAETGRREGGLGNRQSVGGLSVNSALSVPKEEDETEESLSRGQIGKYGTPSSNSVHQRGSDDTRSFLQNDSRLDALDSMTRESIFGGRGPKGGRESSASGRFSDEEAAEDGLDEDSRSASRAASEPLSAGSAFDASQALSDRDDFEAEDPMDQDRLDDERSDSLRSNEQQMISNDEMNKEDENEMPALDDMPSFDQIQEKSLSLHAGISASQNQDQSISHSRSQSSRSPSPIHQDDSSISPSRDPDATVDQSAEASLPSFERMEDDVEDGETSLDRIKKMRDAQKEKEEMEAANVEPEDEYETESDEESDEDEDQTVSKTSKGKQKEKTESSTLKKRISRKKKRFSPYTQASLPLLPSTLFKDLFSTFSLPGMGTAVGRSKNKISIDPGAMEAVEDASYDWFAKFSQELSSQAHRSGRSSTITEGDVVAVMKARGQIPSRSSLPSLARKLLPRELADLFAPAAPISSSTSSSTSNSKPKKSGPSTPPGKGKGKARDSEDEGNDSSSTIKAKPKSTKAASSSSSKAKGKEKLVSRSLAGKPQKVVVSKRKGK